MRLFRSFVTTTLACLWSGLVVAHHSSAGVDTDKVVVLSAVLKEFDFTAPHAQLVLMSRDEQGEFVQTRLWTVAPNMLISQGFKPKDFVIGEKVEVSYHPNRNSAGGIMVSLTLQNGRVVKGDLL